MAPSASDISDTGKVHGFRSDCFFPLLNPEIRIYLIDGGICSLLLVSLTWVKVFCDKGVVA
ncbi:hypothetical protein YC2023_089907 [Brassica napus]